MYKGVNRVLIGDGTTTGSTLPGIKKGDLLFLKEDGSVVTTNTAAAALPAFERVTIAMGIADGIAIFSSPIQGNTVSQYVGKDYVAPVEQVTYLGYDGATAAKTFAITAGVEYRLRVEILDSMRVNGQRLTISDSNYVASATDTAYTVSSKLVELFNQKDYGYNAFGTKIEMAVIANVGTVSVSENILTMVKGSKQGTFTTSAEHGTNVAYVVGDVIRIGGTAATTQIYKIEAISGLVITLDRPYEGASEAVSAANSGQVTGITNYGIKITGLAQSSKISQAANAPLDTYEQIRFTAALSDANDLASAQYVAPETTTKATTPFGYWKLVADAEEAAKANWGDTSKRRFYDQRIASNVVVDETYGCVTITHADIHNGDFQDKANSPLRTEIYIPDGTNQATNSGDNFLHILNGFFSTKLNFTAISTFA